MVCRVGNLRSDLLKPLVSCATRSGGWFTGGLESQISFMEQANVDGCWVVDRVMKMDLRQHLKLKFMGLLKKSLKIGVMKSLYGPKPSLLVKHSCHRTMTFLHTHQDRHPLKLASLLRQPPRMFF